jgi:hypothetical protein
VSLSKQNKTQDENWENIKIDAFKIFILGFLFFVSFSLCVLNLILFFAQT